MIKLTTPAVSLGMLLALALVLNACGKEKTTGIGKNVSDYDYTVVEQWNDLFLQIERHAAGYRPGPAPRALAYMGLSAYEATVSGMPEYQSLASLYTGLDIPQPLDGREYHWPEVVNASQAYLMRRFFPTAADPLFQQISTLEAANESKYRAEVNAEVFDRSKAHGQAVALAVWEWSKTDQIGHDAYLDPFGNYDWQAHFHGDGDWKPTDPGPGKGMFPYWGQVRTFALREDQKICRPPLPFSEATSSKLYAQALEVYSMNTPTLSYEDEWIGEYWSDDLLNLTFSPPPRWIAIANQVYANEKTDLQTAVVCNAKIGMALNDAGVGCWNSKYYYNVERPETYIRRVIDADWHTNLDNPITGEKGITPSFPAYPSGHATFGAAGAEALASMFGYSYAMADVCHKDRTEFIGKPRYFTSFREMANENGWSRIPLGVHFRMDSEEGVRYGTEIGQHVNALPWKK